MYNAGHQTVDPKDENRVQRNHFYLTDLCELFRNGSSPSKGLPAGSLSLVWLRDSPPGP